MQSASAYTYSDGPAVRINDGTVTCMMTSDNPQLVAAFDCPLRVALL
jgi:hypothetical protein